MKPASTRFQQALVRLSVTLSDARSRVGGDEGTVSDGFGDAHEISLERWAGSDSGTRLVIWFSYQQAGLPDGLRGSIYPNDVLSTLSPRG